MTEPPASASQYAAAAVAMAAAASTTATTASPTCSGVDMPASVPSNAAVAAAVAAALAPTAQQQLAMSSVGLLGGGTVTANPPTSTAPPMVPAETVTTPTASGAALPAQLQASINVASSPSSRTDWRDKDADRSTRQQIARAIWTLIIRSTNRPMAASYQPKEIARRLEHNLYMSASSKEEYSNISTVKERLKIALDNSKRRHLQLQQQRQLQQQSAQVPIVPTSTAQASPVAAITAQQLQAQQLEQLMQQRQQKQIAAQLELRKSLQAVPFPQAMNAIAQPPVDAQPLQMPLAMPPSIQASPAVALPVTPSGGGSSILDELEREADAMANGVNDEPIAMPESEMDTTASSTVSAASLANFAIPMPPTTSTVTTGGFNATPISMPPEISGVGATPSTSVAFVQSNPTVSVSTVPTSVGTPMFNGMNLTAPQLQQHIQQIQQIQQLRRMQELKQFQQQQQVVNVAANMGLNVTASPIAGAPPRMDATTPIGASSAVSGADGMSVGPAPAMAYMSGAAIAQKREELKQRLIQLKHARTCTAGTCNVDYCSTTKALLNHVSQCANAQCMTPGCKSTRQLLSHFRKCRNLQCDVCSAIRPPMNATEQQLVLRRQQQRLCMLRHASTCKAPTCVLPYCAGMRLLWNHICECHQRQCRTDHCISSRYVLSHFKQCNKMICEVCGPVRKAIKIVDSCKGNLPQLQLIASQVPENVRDLIKIMNTTLPSPAVSMQSATPNGVASIDPSAVVQQNGDDGTVVKSEHGVAKPAVEAPTVAPSAPSGHAEGEVSTESKKKVQRFQTEKEKKIRRREQAKIAKERAQAKANAAAAAAAAAQGIVVGPKNNEIVPKPGPPPVSSVIQLGNGLVVRGVQAKLRGDQLLAQHDISFLDSMTEAQLDEHIRSLRFSFCGHITLNELRSRLMPLVQKLMDSENGWAFNKPVNPLEWNIPDYFDIIKCPMDLGTIKKRLENEHYNSIEAFASDVRLVFENAIAYNSSTNTFNIAAKHLLSFFDKQLSMLKTQLEKQLFKRCEQRKEEMCQLCGGESFKFAPSMLFCSGPCNGRIRRHTHYYSDPRGEHHWCSSCFKLMKDGPIDMSALPQLSGAPPEGGANDVVLTKSSLLKRKNSEVAEEPWVECDSCKLWYHQICALFNERNHAISGEQEAFVCPICVKKQRAKGAKPSLENGLKAQRLPITRMAKLIEERVLRAIAKAEEAEVTRMDKLGNADSIGFKRNESDPKSESSQRITIREVLSVDKQVQIKPKMGKLLYARYGKSKKADTKAGHTATDKPKSLKRQRSSESKKKATSSSLSVHESSLQLTYRSRCICVFQELDGVDVLIFTLYVQEYGPNSLQPNAGRVYVSYLDSVNYFQPKKLRTLMHQQVMLGFLEDCRNRGFHTCHIWSCPPLKGDDYIFFCKPENQKIPKAARLRGWYQKLLQEGKKEGLLFNISNLYAEYYLRKKRADELPYFEGDYWPRLAEDLIKQMEEKSSGRGDKSSEGAVSVDEIAGHGQDLGTSSSSRVSISGSPSPSEDGGESVEVGSSAALSSTTGKSKRKRSNKQASPESTPSASTRSTSKARSKKASPTSRSSSSSKNVVNPDPLMQKLKGILEPQKDDFFVVDLYPKCHKCMEPMLKKPHWALKTRQPSSSVCELLEAVKKHRATSSTSRNTPPRHYQHFYCLSCYELNKAALQHRVEVAANGAKHTQEICDQILPLDEKTIAAQIADLDMQEIKYDLSLELVDPNDDTKEGYEEETKPEPMVDVDATSTAVPAADIEANKIDDGKAQAESKAAVVVTPTMTPTVKSNGKAKLKSKVKKERDLDDVIMPCEIFDTREAFLMYCQNNHCQFDQLRRAKHSSMMVLYHLFNQGTTGFTFSCTGCKVTLLSGNRWNCSICPLFNLCDDCHAKTKHEHPLHLFKIVAIPRIGIELPPDPIGPLPNATTMSGTGKNKRSNGSANATGSHARVTKRDANGTEVKRAKTASASTPTAVKAGERSRKRKLHQASPAAATAQKSAGIPSVDTSAPPIVGAKPSAVPSPSSSISIAGTTTANGASTPSGSGSDSNDANKRRRPSTTIDPQLLLQLEHASGCSVADCMFTNCQRMRSMLKHGVTCKERGSCVLCKRIVFLLSTHARQCKKEYHECKVPRCADIRRHIQQVALRQQQQQQLQQLQLQTQSQQASGLVPGSDTLVGGETQTSGLGNEASANSYQSVDLNHPSA